MSAGGSCTADALPVAALAALHVFSGAIERVLFARLAASMPHSVLLMHTLLAGLSALLFGVLRLARSQSSQAPVSEALQRVRPSDVVLMALLGTMHSLLALAGARLFLSGLSEANQQRVAAAARLALRPLVAERLVRHVHDVGVDLVAGGEIAGRAPHGGGHALLPRQPGGRGRGASFNALATIGRGLGHGALAALRATTHRDSVWRTLQ